MRSSAIARFYSPSSEGRTEFECRVTSVLFVQFVTLQLVPWKSATLIPTILQSKLKKTCYGPYIARLKIRLPPAPGLVKVYIQILENPEIIVNGVFIRALKFMHSGDTQVQTTEKFLSIPSTLILVGVEAKQCLAFASLVSLLPSFFSLKGGIIQFKSFQLCYFILSWDFYHKRRDSEQLLNKVNSLNYTVISTKSNDGDIDGLNFSAQWCGTGMSCWKHHHFVKF